MVQIVVIEDNVQNARMAAKLLRRAGYEVLVAEDGEMGLTTVYENTPDLILIDLGLPDIDGQTVIGLVRQHEALKNLPIIAFTAWPPDEAHDMATRYGCDGVITKPINTRTFADQIGAFLPKNELSETKETETSSEAPPTVGDKPDNVVDASSKSSDTVDIVPASTIDESVSTKPETPAEKDKSSATEDEIVSEPINVVDTILESDESVSTKPETASEPSPKNDAEDASVTNES